MKSIVLVVGLTLLLIAVPLRSQSLTNTEKADIEKLLKNQVAQYLSTYEKIDLQAAIEFWSRDNLIGAIGYGQHYTTIEAVTGYLARQNKGRKEQTIDVQDVKIRILSPNMAVAQVSYNWRIIAANGNVSNYVVALTEYWVKESSGWKLTFEAGSSAARQ